MYDNGKGVDYKNGGGVVQTCCRTGGCQSSVQSRSHNLRACCRKGHAKAQFNLGLMYPKEKAFHRTIRQRRSGTDVLPNRGMPMLSSIWVPCTSTEKAFHRTIRRRSSGSSAQSNLGAMSYSIMSMPICGSTLPHHLNEGASESRTVLEN